MCTYVCTCVYTAMTNIAGDHTTTFSLKTTKPTTYYSGKHLLLSDLQENSETPYKLIVAFVSHLLGVV